MVVLVSGSVADVAAYAETVLIAPFFSFICCESQKKFS
jgi:hypothetical protein